MHWNPCNAKSSSSDTNQWHNIIKLKNKIKSSLIPILPTPKKQKQKTKTIAASKRKDQETLTNTIKQSTQQRGKEGTKTQRYRTQVGARQEVRGRRTITWRATRFATVPRIDCLLADDDCGACDRASVWGRKTFLLVFGFSAAPQSAAQSRTQPTWVFAMGSTGPRSFRFSCHTRDPCKWLPLLALVSSYWYWHFENFSHPSLVLELVLANF